MRKTTPRSSRDTVDAYIGRFSGETKRRLVAIRTVIRRSAPRAEEKMSYGMPGYKLEGRPLVYFAAFANHIGLYALPSSVVMFQKELKTYKTSKGTVQFQHDEPLPLSLVKKIVIFRVKENLARTTKKT
jgi:uncharacterized protein YdhG (YjbR/CyaY superfamily)